MFKIQQIMINNIQTKLYFLSLSIFIIFIDQFTKYLIFYYHKIFLNKDFLLSLITPLPASVGISTTFSTMIISGSIGLIFGVLPEKRASKLDPIVALRSL